MNDPDVLVLLPGFRLPINYAWRAGLVATMRRSLRNCGYDGRDYRPPRFVGYYFRAKDPIGVCADGHLRLAQNAPLNFLPDQVRAVAGERFEIIAADREKYPHFVLIHDSWDGQCWLRRFPFGFRFLALRELPFEDELGCEP